MFGRLQPEPGAPAGGRTSSFPAILRGLNLRRYWWLAALTAVLLIAAITVGTIEAVRSRVSTQYQTQTVVKQDLSQAVTASGTVNPQNTVNVGTQVSGTVSQVYVDYNSRVKQGQILARIDPTQLQSQLNQAEASLQQAEAQAAAASNNATGAQSSVTASEATSAAQEATARAATAGIATAESNVAKSQSALALAQQTVNRDNQLLSQGYIAQSTVDADKSNLVVAQTGLESAQAALQQARAQAAASQSQAQASVAQSSQSGASAAGSANTAAAAQAAVQVAEGQVQQDQLNIQHSVITSPVDGTVIARSVEPGVTVAASFQTPTLFSIAQNLKKMEVDIAVGEPDIGNVKPNDQVTFSVLAYPNQTFNGIVSQVRENPTTVNNVVTYTVVSLVNNPNNQLLPGMTANATINVKTVKNALVVPTQALTWKPTAGSFKGAHHHRTGTGTSTASAAQRSGSTAAGATGSPWGQVSGAASSSIATGSTGVIFVDVKGQPTPVRVKIDLVSNALAAVTPLRGSLTAGEAVIVSSGSPGSATQTTPAQGGQQRGGFGGIGRALH